MKKEILDQLTIEDIKEIHYVIAKIEWLEDCVTTDEDYQKVINRLKEKAV